MSFQRAEPESTCREQPLGWFGMRDPNSFAPHDRDPKAIPAGRVTELASGSVPPFSDLVGDQLPGL